jgi:hypothetical protein
MHQSDEDGPYFTIIVNEHCGIADKLHNRFITLMSLGTACGLHYVHSPFNFGRSNNAWWKRLARRIHAQLFFRLGILLHPSIHRSFNNSKSAISKYREVQACEVYQFLGLRQFKPVISEPQFNDYDRVEIDVACYFAFNKVVDIKAFSQFIASQGNPRNSRKIYFLHSGDGFYDQFNRIKQFLNSSAAGELEKAMSQLRTQFWNVPVRSATRGSDDEPLIRLVIHIRVGDRCAIGLPTRKLVFFGERITTEAPLPAENNASADYGDGLAMLSKCRDLIQRITKELADHKYSCVVISDGYERALFCLTKAMSQGRIKLNALEVRTIREFQRDLQAGWRDIVGMKSTQVILGESLKDTLASVDAISQADVLVRGQGGFSWAMHKLYNRQPHSMVVDISEFSNVHAQKIKSLAQSLQSVRQPAHRLAQSG